MDIDIIAVLCIYSANDDTGGTDTQIANQLSKEQCAYSVWKAFPTATAATFGVLGQSKAAECYAEFGTKSASASSIYEFFIFLLNITDNSFMIEIILTPKLKSHQNLKH